MSLSIEPLLEDQVRPEWVDYNGHMNDAAYAGVFSLAVERLMEMLGITAAFRDQQQYSIYTLETHLCYLGEAHEGQELCVTVQLLDHDQKRLHVFFAMEDQDGNRLATSEQMLMGMDMQQGRPASFPAPIELSVKELAESQKDEPAPENAGRIIKIHRRSK
ncbi:MAG TPA: thioesterase family protein [Bacillales bacterium]|nr:thioesterase family protein [Bacillales bacterium]